MSKEAIMKTMASDSCRDGAVTDVTDWISDMRSRLHGIQRTPGVDPTYNVYVGWIQEADVRALAASGITR